MGRSLEKRLNGNESAFLRDVEWWGRLEALTIWSERLGGYRSYEGLSKFLLEKTQNPNFGLVPKINLYGGMDAFDKFVVALRKHFAKVEVLESEHRTLREEHEALKRIVKIKAMQDNQRILPILEMLEA